MWSGGGVVEVSGDDDGDFEPLPLRVSQQVSSGKRKAVETRKNSNKVPAIIKRSPFFFSAPSKAAPVLKLERTSSACTQRRASDNFELPRRSKEADSSSIATDKLESAQLQFSIVNGGELNVRTAEKNKTVPCSQSTPDGVRLTGKLDVPGSSPANPVCIGARVYEDDSAIVSLRCGFKTEAPTAQAAETLEAFSSAKPGADCSDLEHDINEGPVRFLGYPVKNSSRKRPLSKVVYRDLNDVGTSSFKRFKLPTREEKRASKGDANVRSTLKGLDSLRREKIGRAVVRDVNNSAETSVSDQDEIPAKQIWEEEFALFANRKPSEAQILVQPNVTAAMDALEQVASKGQILHIEKIPARLAAFTNQEFKLPKKLQKALQERGIKRFYSHQAEAMDAVFNGSSIVAATPTASGKSMTYIIPVLDSLMKVPKSRALFIFPVKALARDQLNTLCELSTYGLLLCLLFSECLMFKSSKAADLVAEVKQGSHCYCYDGDTDKDKKAHIRKTGKIILTNPDMIHHGVLPNHQLWEQFFSNLKFVVIDEAHTYRGIFGSHVGCILRRLLRIARHYGSEPMFICCSATIANPEEHLKKLTTIDMEVIHGSGAPAGEKQVVCWRPPESKTGERRSLYKETVKIVVALMKANLQILVFVEARKVSELICRLVRAKLLKQHRSDLLEKVDSYRAGYTQGERIALEKRLQGGQLRALVTTRALELGIDVGDLDATVHVGLPATMCSLWQQAGRAGRRQGVSLAIIIGRERPRDVFYMKNPQKLFAKDVEQAICNPLNPEVLRLQLPCAAKELPLCGDDVEYFGEYFRNSRDKLVSEGVLQYKTGPRGESLYENRYGDPASDISIRGISSNQIKLLTGGNEMVEEVDEKMARRMLYQGAIYPHARDTYRIKWLDIDNKQAFGELCDVHHMTEVNMKVIVEIIEKTASRTTLGTRVHMGKLKVIEQVMGYSEYDVTKNKLFDTVNLKSSPYVFETVGLWWDVPVEVMQKLKHMAYDALVVLRRVVLPLLASMTMSDSTDMLGLETMAHEQTEQPQIFLYDAYAGGIGIAVQAFQDVEEAWRRALNLLKNCDCRFGCHVCTQSAHDTVASEANSSKHAAISLLEYLLLTRQATSTLAPKGHVNALPIKANDQVQSPTDAKPPSAQVNQDTKIPIASPGSIEGPYVSVLKASSRSRVLSSQQRSQVVIDLS